MNELRDEFLSEEDLDLRSLSEDELYAWWDAWLLLDQYTYSHGVFTQDPTAPAPRPRDPRL